MVTKLLLVSIFQLFLLSVLFVAAVVTGEELILTFVYVMGLFVWLPLGLNPLIGLVWWIIKKIKASST